jgi:hypothetical protein
VSVTGAAEFAESQLAGAFAAGLGSPIVTTTALSARQHDSGTPILPRPKARRRRGMPAKVGRTPIAGRGVIHVAGRQKLGAELFNQSVHLY